MAAFLYLNRYGTYMGVIFYGGNYYPWQIV
jgi:hypothetical protein